jgi:hypothetical protein
MIMRRNAFNRVLLRRLLIVCSTLTALTGLPQDSPTADDDETPPPVSLSDLCPEREAGCYYNNIVRNVDRLVETTFGVCAAVYDQDWGDRGLPVQCGCPRPTDVQLPDMMRTEFSVVLKCAHPTFPPNDDEAPERWLRDNPTRYSENICREYRRSLYDEVIDGIPGYIDPLGPTDFDLQHPDYPPEELLDMWKNELQRRMGLYIGSYKDFSSAPSFYQCAGGISFLEVKLCPNVIPSTTRRAESHDAQMLICKRQAIQAIRSTLIPSGSPLNYSQWFNTDSEWYAFEREHFMTAYRGDEPVDDQESLEDMSYGGRNFDYLTIEQTIDEFRMLSDHCKSARPSLENNRSLEEERRAFNDNANERASEFADLYRTMVTEAAARWNEEQRALADLARRENEDGSGETNPVPVLNESEARVMMRVPCDRKCDLEKNTPLTDGESGP